MSWAAPVGALFGPVGAAIGSAVGAITGSNQGGTAPPVPAIAPSGGPLSGPVQPITGTGFMGGAPPPWPTPQFGQYQILGDERWATGATGVTTPPDYASFGTPAAPSVPWDTGGTTTTGGEWRDTYTGGAAAGIPWGGVATVGIPAVLMGGAVAAGRLLLPAIERVLPKWLLGTTIAGSVYELYKRLRSSGHHHKRARRLALAAHGVMLRRRRMRATNIHALRRAIRRVHSFKRVARKVGALGVGRRRLLASPGYRRRRFYRRGDLDPFIVEDYADMMDEAEDAGLEPDMFPAGEAAD